MRKICFSLGLICLLICLSNCTCNRCANNQPSSFQDKPQEIKPIKPVIPTAEKLLQAVKDNPKDAKAHVRLAMAYYEAEYYQDALHHYEEAAKLTENQPMLLLAIAICHRQLKEYDKALNALEKALNMAKDNENIWNELVLIYSVIDKTDSAQEAFITAQSLNPNSPYPFINMGNAYLIREEISRSLDYFYHAQSIDPKQPEIHYWLGLALYRHGDYNQALESFERYINENGKKIDNSSDVLLNPLPIIDHTADVFYYAGLCCEAQGDKLKAYKLMENAAQLNHKNAINWLKENPVK